MEGAIVAAHRDDAAVTAAHPTRHDALDGDLNWPSVADRDLRGCGEHPFRPARIQHHGRPSIESCQMSFEGCDDSARFAQAAVFGGQHEADANFAEEVEVE